MDREAGWWTTSGNIGLPPLARVMGVGRQQHHGGNILEYGSCYGFVCCDDRFFLFPPCINVSALSTCNVTCFCCCDFYVFVVCVFGSRVSPSIFGLMFMGSVMLSICSSSCVLYSAWSGVKRACACFLVWVEGEVVCLSPCMYFM